MSEWNYTKCAKPFESAAEAKAYMEERDFAGYVLQREVGFTAVCPTYPEGYYPDAKKIAEIENSKFELKAASDAASSNCC